MYTYTCKILHAHTYMQMLYTYTCILYTYYLKVYLTMMPTLNYWLEGRFAMQWFSWISEYLSSVPLWNTERLEEFMNSLLVLQERSNIFKNCKFNSHIYKLKKKYNHLNRWNENHLVQFHIHTLSIILNGKTSKKWAKITTIHHFCLTCTVRVPASAVIYEK